MLMRIQRTPAFTVSRRDVLRWSAGAAAIGALPAMRAWAQAGGSSDESDGDDQARQRAISKGLRWLKEKQRKAGGFEGGRFSLDPAVTALAGRAFLAAGSVPGRGAYGDALQRCVEYLTTNTDERGYIHIVHEGRSSTMYGHGYATAFLADAYRASMHEPLRETIERSVRLLADVQGEEGGWRYVPSKRAGADVSVTACQLLALAHADQAGVDVPRETIERAVDYLTSCQNDDGGFRYVLRAGGSAPQRSAAALAALVAAGRSMNEVLGGGRDYLDAQRPTAGEALSRPHMYYWAYFSVQAMCRESNKSHEAWRRLLSEALLAAQRTDGSWNDAAIGPAYATAVACYVLSRSRSE
jgi:hypothetical protein